MKCRDVSDWTVFLNLDHAISIVPLERTSLTRVAFIGVEKDTAERCAGGSQIGGGSGFGSSFMLTITNREDGSHASLEQTIPQP